MVYGTEIVFQESYSMVVMTIIMTIIMTIMTIIIIAIVTIMQHGNNARRQIKAQKVL